MTITFEVLGEPMGKQRPRVSVIGSKYAHAYTPKETINYESKVIFSYTNSTKETFGTSELRCKIVAFYKLQKSHYGKKGVNKSGLDKLNGITNPTTKPDCDNIAKICLDALNGIAYHDDSQIVKLVVEKKYSELPKVVITLTNDLEREIW